MIYIDENIDGFDLDEALAAVSPQRREYALRYRQERDQRLCLAAYRLLQRALLLEYGIEELPMFIYEEGCKPMLQGHPDIHFSLSHCREAVAVAVSNRPIGIDIETTAHYSPEVVRRVMNDDEMMKIKASSRPDVAFTRLWTMKESLYKLTGNDNDGDTTGMLANASQYCFTTTVHPRYIYTACTTLSIDTKPPRE